MKNAIATAGLALCVAAGAGADECPCPSPSPGVDPNYSRLLFAPTARPLARGDGHFADYELLFPGVAYGVTDNFSIGAGLSVIPGLGLREQVFYVAPKLGFNLGERGAVAVGGLFAQAGPWDDYDRNDSIGAGYAIGTLGGRRRSLSLGIGAVKEINGGPATPLLMLGGSATVARHVALVGESWVRLGETFETREQALGLGVRFFGEKLSADVGVVLLSDVWNEGFPAPWGSITYHFGGRGRPKN